MKNVLIPTDFSLNSLETINLVAQAMPGKMNILLFHAFDMPDCLMDAIRRTGLKGHTNLVTEELRTKCKRIKAANKEINNIYFRIMYGTTYAAFNNFAKANNVTHIIWPAGYRFMPVVRESVNPDRMFRRSGIEIISKFDLWAEPSGPANDTDRHSQRVSVN